MTDSGQDESETAGPTGELAIDGSDNHDEVEVSLAQLKTRRSRDRRLPTARRTADVLPLHEIGPEAFESVIAELVASQKNRSAHFYGRRGQAQYGLDIVEEKADNQRILYQVKRFERITPRDIRQAVTEYAGPARTAASSLAPRRFHPTKFVVVTSAHIDDDTALVDCIGDLQDTYRGDLGIDVWGAETVSRKLRSNRGLVHATFGPSWADEWCGSEGRGYAQAREKRTRYVHGVLNTAMKVQFGKDNEIRFRQVDLPGVAVESLFVDVPASSHPGSPAEDLLTAMNPQTHVSDLTRDESSYRAGAAQALLHPGWTESTVVVGGPGQGKTTLLQFLCQFHRARALDRSEYSPIAAGLAQVTRVKRFAIRIELSSYAAWRRDRITKAKFDADPKPDLALESYIAHVIAEDSGQNFSTEDFALGIATTPMLLALDGLDEVADTNDRIEIDEEVRRANSRIMTATRGTMVVVATRPGNVGSPIWRDLNFAALFLHQLTPGLRMQYLDRWSAQSKLEKSEVADLRDTFVRSMELPHVVELAGNPMQLAILLNLMQRQAVLPEKRTALYERYIDVFMDRESKSPIVADSKDIIIAFHKRLGWYIHSQVEKGRSSGSINLNELRQLLNEYLTPRGYDTTFVNELFDSVTTRVLCLVQRELDSQEFQFEVQPLREYFAAEHIYDVSPNNTPANNRAGCLSALIRRPFWSNVMRFYAGKFSEGEVPSIYYALRDIRSDRAIGPHPITRLAAKYLLDDRVLGGQLELVVADVVRVILDGVGPVLAIDGLLQQDETVIRFQDRAGLKQAVAMLKEQLQAGTDETLLHSAAQLLVHLGRASEAVETWWLRQDLPCGLWLQIAASLRALDRIDEDRRKAISRFTALAGPGDDVLCSLIASQTSESTESLTSACLSELRSGHAHIPPELPVGSPYARLAVAASIDRYYDHRSAANTGPPPRAVKTTHRRRARTRSSTTGLDSAVRTLESAHAGGPWTNPNSWYQLFDNASDFWGADCWAIREALVTLPTSAIPAASSKTSLSQGTPWKGVARWRGDAIQNRSDSNWWRDEARKCVDTLAASSFVFYALSTASASTLRELCEVLDEIVEPLPLLDFGAVAEALRRYAASAIGPGKVNVSEALRLRQLTPRGRLAVLLWQIGDPTTHKRLSPYVVESLGSMWRAGHGVSSAISELLPTYDKRIPVERFRGARTDLPGGTIGPKQVTQMTFSDAIDVLDDPGTWPTDIVRLAADRLSTRLSNQTALADVADAAEWRTYSSNRRP